MERLKVAALVTIACALVAQLLLGRVPEAHAEGVIQCSAFQAEQIITYGTKTEKAEAAAKAHGDRVAAWLMSTSGEVVFRSSLVQNQGAAFIDVVCVR